MDNIVSSISSFVSSFFTTETSTESKENNAHTTTDHTTEGSTTKISNDQTTKKLDEAKTEGDQTLPNSLVQFVFTSGM